MKKILCLFISALLISGLMSSCSLNSGESAPAESEEVQDLSENSGDSGDSSLSPTEEELDKLCKITFAVHKYDCESENAVYDAYEIALLYGAGIYNDYTDGNAFEKCEFIESQDPDPLDLMYDGFEYEGYNYMKTNAESVDRFLREIMNVEPDHDIYNYASANEGYPCIYYYEGYYYTSFGIYGNGSSNRLLSCTGVDDGWYQVNIGYYAENPEEIDNICTVTAKIVLVDGERCWSIKTISWDYDD